MSGAPTPKLVGTREPGTNPAMQPGWPGVIRVLTRDEARQSERRWDARFADAAGRCPVCQHADGHHEWCAEADQFPV